MMTTNETNETVDEETPRAAPRTFRVWELTATYRLLGLRPDEARDAAVADLRMFPAENRFLREEMI